MRTHLFHPSSLIHGDSHLSSFPTHDLGRVHPPNARASVLAAYNTGFIIHAKLFDQLDVSQ
jgi:hypothetical protein